MTDGGAPGFLPAAEAAWLRRLLDAGKIVDRAVRSELTQLAERIHEVGHGGGYERGYLDGFADSAAGKPPRLVDTPPAPPVAPDPPIIDTPCLLPRPPWDDPELQRLDPDSSRGL